MSPASPKHPLIYILKHESLGALRMLRIRPILSIIFTPLGVISFDSQHSTPLHPGLSPLICLCSHYCWLRPEPFFMRFDPKLRSLEVRMLAHLRQHSTFSTFSSSSAIHTRMQPHACMHQWMEPKDVIMDCTTSPPPPPPAGGGLATETWPCLEGGVVSWFGLSLSPYVARPNTASDLAPSVTSSHSSSYSCSYIARILFILHTHTLSLIKRPIPDNH